MSRGNYKFINIQTIESLTKVKTFIDNYLDLNLKDILTKLRRITQYDRYHRIYNQISNELAKMIESRRVTSQEVKTGGAIIKKYKLIHG